MHTAFLLSLSIVVLVFWVVVVSTSGPDPGICYKVAYSDHPELAEIWQAFRDNCTIPDIPGAYFRDTLASEEFQRMRAACQTMEDVAEWEAFELGRTDRSEIERFYDKTIYPVSGYKPRLGCFTRDIPAELEQFAMDRIQGLQNRLGLANRLARDSDSRGSTFTPAGGFMEPHSNQKHHGGWRLYFHYLPDDHGKSWFQYVHPYDRTLRRIQDSNETGNLFRIRKPPQALLWHTFWSDTPRHSWGLWISPELAAYLKQGAFRV